MKKILFLSCLSVLAWMGISCNSPQQQKLQPMVKHVVMVGIDGWAAHDLAQAHDIPNIRNLMANGSYTLHKRSVLPSASAINWASTFMGAPTELHGYTKWNSKVPEIPALVQNNHNIFPTIYSVIREQKPEAETGCTFDWDGVKFVVDTLAISHWEYIPDSYVDINKNCTIAENYIKEKKPFFYTAYFGTLDETGHEHGWYTPEYYNTLAEIDQVIGRLIQALKDAGIYDDTIFIITSDHGGIDKGHGGMTIEELETPFIVCGKGIKKGFETPDVVMQYDVPATIAYILGIQQPQAWVGRPVMSFFE